MNSSTTTLRSTNSNSRRKQDYLKVGVVSKLNIFRKANPDWMSEVSLASAKKLDNEDEDEDEDEYEDEDEDEDEDDDDDDDDGCGQLFIQLRNALIGVPKNNFKEDIPLALLEEQNNMTEVCNHQMVYSKEQRRAGDEIFNLIGICKICNYSQLY